MKELRMERQRARIFKQFLYSERLRFSEIFRKTKIPSNLLAYFLKKMLAEGVLEKEKGDYRLSQHSEKLIPFFSEAERLNPLVVVLIACVRDGKILLAKREKWPFKGFWSLCSGRMLISERVRESAERIMREKYISPAKFEKVCAVVFEMLVEKESPKHGFVFFLVKARPLEKIADSKNLKWFSLKRLSKKGIIASDYWMIKERLSEKANFSEHSIREFGKSTRLQFFAD